jgi:hypothetical protein
MIALPSASSIGAFSYISIGIRPTAFAVITLLALLLPRLGEKAFFWLETSLSRFAQRKTLSLAILFASILLLRLCLLPWLRVPIPGIHDAFSYLLLGDTFAHGRLANPSHPMWISLETFHVNWIPTYHSMYPPAQGVALALGQILGHPWIGVLLSDAAMCAAIVWMLQAWVPARWALLGGILAGIKFGVASYWMNNYWGGAVAAIGGALVLGALARIIRHSRPRDAVLLGLGLAILANSRPYEGLVFSIPAAVYFLLWLVRGAKSRGSAKPPMWRVVVPLLGVLLGTATFMTYYNWRLTGKPLLMPHTLNTRTYHSTAVFLWQHPGPEKEYRNAQFTDFYSGWERENYQNTGADVRRVCWEKIQRCGHAYFWPGLLLTLPALPWALSDRKMLLPWITLALGGIAIFVVIWSNAHYAAPFTGAIYLIIVQTIRHLRTMGIAAKPVGMALARAAVILLILDTVADVRLHRCDPLPWTCEGDVSRFAILEKLKHEPGKHLIMVRYDPDHNVHDEWVYNGADIDNSKVLWARELDPQQNSRLLAYFHDRKIWLVTPDSDNTYLAPYTPPDAKSPPSP